MGRPARRRPARWSLDGLSAITGTDEAVFGAALVAQGAAGAGRRGRQRTGTTGRGPADACRCVSGCWPTRAEIGRMAGGDGAARSASALERQCAAEQARLDEGPAAGAAGREWPRRGTGMERPLHAAYARWREAEADSPTGVEREAIGGAARGARDRARGWVLPAWWRRCETWLPGTASTCCPPAEEQVDAGRGPRWRSYALTAREREVLRGAGERADEQGDRGHALHQRQDRVGARLQHAAQDGRERVARRRRGSPTAWGPEPEPHGV